MNSVFSFTLETSLVIETWNSVKSCDVVMSDTSTDSWREDLWIKQTDQSSEMVAY